MLVEPSHWRYDTGATGGIGIEFVALSGGALYLVDPGGQSLRLWFGAIGAGLTAGFKIPKLPKARINGKSVGGAGSLKAFPSTGRVFKSHALGKRELTPDDLRGGVVFVEAGGGLVVGGSGTAMLFGINAIMLAAGLSNPGLAFLTAQAIEGARGALIYGGTNVGVQAGGGIAGLIGYMH